MLAALDALRDEWARRLGSLSEKERARVRQRSLRRLSVETGILERLYDLEWGLTLTLVAEGFTRDVVERAGGRVDDRTLATLRAQMDSLELVLDFVRQQRSLSASFIKELHQAITRTQDTYVVTDSLGRVVEAVLPRGQWKSQPNHVLRQDNTLLEYAPPEQVASEIDRLVALWSDLEAGEGHPIVKAAWLHHRFVQIHPFADGNGRVARALTLLVIEKYHYAPLVVDRWHRDAYLRCLKAANDGNLADLVRLFAKLEGGALTGELERPPEIDRGGVAVRVAHTLAAQLVEARRSSQIELQQRLVARALAVGGRLRAWFDGKREELSGVFAGQGLTDVAVFSDSEMPPTPLKTHWFRWQVTESAHAAGHYADFSVFTGWASLRIRLDSWLLRYVASLHGAGRDPGVMAVTTFAEIEPVVPTPEDEAAPRRQYVQTTADAFRFVHAESAEHIHDRAQELEDLLDEGLAVALLELRKRA
ncbi:MAG TPA: Fic family protein [Vicinamibacteria bacterium]|nr:Fic family protein [Vicinamibacteria bacterium]